MDSKPAPETFLQQFEEIVRRFPDRTAFRLKTHEEYPRTTYREARRQAIGVASGLIALGLTGI